MAETEVQSLFDPQPDPALEALLDAAIEADFAARPVIPAESMGERHLKPAMGEEERASLTETENPAVEATIAVLVNQETLQRAMDVTGVENPTQLVEFALHLLADSDPSSDIAGDADPGKD